MTFEPNQLPEAAKPAGPAMPVTDESLPSVRWDAFLENSILGQFQQTSRWARIKALDGWKAERIFLNPQQPEAGGLQLLWKSTRIGRIGYVSKGPVLPTEDPSQVNAIMGKLKETARTLGLRALILQPPDLSSIGAKDLCRHNFGPNPVESVVRATAIIDLTQGRHAWEKRMHSKTRQQARTAVKRGVTVHLGERKDLRLFFDLMCESCRRQNTSPNPSRVESLEALWDQFQPNLTVGFASVGGETIAGLLMIGLGRRMLFWKKGWNSQGSQLYANCLLMVEALNWARARGYETVDFGALDQGIAETLLAGGQLSEEQLRSRDKFNLSLGVAPRLLPPAQLLIINPALRQLYDLCSRYRPLANWMMKKMGSG